MTPLSYRQTEANKKSFNPGAATGCQADHFLRWCSLSAQILNMPTLWKLIFTVKYVELVA
jgi:hypothetical protein